MPVRTHDEGVSKGSCQSAKGSGAQQARAKSSTSSAPAGMVLRLLRTAGNRAVQGLVKSPAGWQASVGLLDGRGLFRQPSGEPPAAIGPTDKLQSPRFAGDARLERVYHNAPPMRQGEIHEAVKKIQQALIDDGFSMPISTRKLGEPDGIFGPETFETVQAFQTKYGLLERGKADGVVGTHTMGKLDRKSVV